VTITKEKAWTIFRAEKLGQPEGQAAIKALQGLEWGDYHLHAQEFEMKLAQIGVEAQNEGVAIWEAHPNTQEALGLIPQHSWTADNYWSLISLFKGSKFETLHLSAMFRVANNELLLELVKP
jgi:hypothetical protein